MGHLEQFIDLVPEEEVSSAESFVFAYGQWKEIERGDIEQLSIKDIDSLFLFGCKMGLTDSAFNNSLASTFYSIEGNRQSIGMIIVGDGNVNHGWEKVKRTLYADGTDGFKRYSWEEGKLKMEKNIDIRMYMDNLSTKGYEGIVCEPNGGKNKDEKKKDEKK